MITEPSFKRPFASASSIIAFAIRSLTLPAGLKDSTFAISFACSPSFSSIRFSSTSGVFPTRSKMLSYTFAIVHFLLILHFFISLFPIDFVCFKLFPSYSNRFEMSTHFTGMIRKDGQINRASKTPTVIPTREENKAPARVYRVFLIRTAPK